MDNNLDENIIDNRNNNKAKEYNDEIKSKNKNYTKKIKKN